jgi:hypothetical protein
MGVEYLVGNDGGITFPSQHGALLSAWDATFSRTSTEITGFADTGVRRRLGVADMRGTARGSFIYDTTNSKPGIGHTNFDGSSIVLFPKAAATVCSWTMTGVVESIAGSVDKNGGSEVTFTFANSNGTAPTESWDET